MEEDFSWDVTLRFEGEPGVSYLGERDGEWGGSKQEEHLARLLLTWWGERAGCRGGWGRLRTPGPRQRGGSDGAGKADRGQTQGAFYILLKTVHCCVT